MATKKHPTAAKKAAGTQATNVKRGGLSQGVITLLVGLAIAVMSVDYLTKRGGATLAFGIILLVLGVFVTAMGVVQLVVTYGDRRRQ